MLAASSVSQNGITVSLDEGYCHSLHQALQTIPTWVKVYASNRPWFVEMAQELQRTIGADSQMIGKT